MPFRFGEDGDPLDGFDVEEPGLAALQETPPEEAPVPGYTMPDDGGLQPPAPDVEEDYGAIMLQVDRRLKVAHYFRLVLDNTMFDDSSAEARFAESRVRKFVRDELEVLIGMRQAQPTASAAGQFTDEEMMTLRELIARLRKPVAPEFKPIQAMQPPPAPKRQLTPMKMPQAQTAPAQPRPAAPPRQAQPPAPRARAGGVDPRIPEQHRADPTAQVINGKVYIQSRNDDGEPLWSRNKRTGKTIPVLKDVTPVAKPMGSIQPVTMPSIAQFNSIQQQHAADSIAALERMAASDKTMRNIAGGLVHSLKDEE